MFGEKTKTSVDFLCFPRFSSFSSSVPLSFSSDQNTNQPVEGLCKNLSKMRISDQKTKQVQDLSLLLQDPFLEASSRFQGRVQSSHGDYNNKLFLGLQNMSPHSKRSIGLVNGGNEKVLPPNLALEVRGYGSVYLMAKDLKGCIFLQKFLENGSSLHVMILFKEVIKHVAELSIDRFGNDVIQKVLQVCNQDQRTQILLRFTSKPGLLLKISLDSCGTRVVQKLIETVSTKEQISLIKSALKPEFLPLVKTMTGIYVLQSCLKSFGPNDNKFVLEDTTKFCLEIATHPHGFPLLKHCLVYSVGEEREKLLLELSKNFLNLAQHCFGNRVVEYIIDQKLGGVDLMLRKLKGSVVKLATHMFGVHLVEKFLTRHPDSRSQIVHELVSAPEFEEMYLDPFGYYVIESALSVTNGVVRESLEERIQRCGDFTNPQCQEFLAKINGLPYKKREAKELVL